MVLCQLDEWMHDYNELAPTKAYRCFFQENLSGLKGSETVRFFRGNSTSARRS